MLRVKDLFLRLILTMVVAINVSISTYAADVTLFDCNDLGDNWVVLTVTDASGSSDTAWSKVTVVDNAAPSVVAQNYSVALDASGTATVIGEPS